MTARDRVGLGWRPPLAAGILANLEHIDVVEVIAEEYFDAPRAAVRGLRMLARQVPVLLHGVSAGLASASPVERQRLEQIARLCDAVAPESWSEHLAFVRAGGVELGHLAAPPRCEATLRGLADNLDRAWVTVGAAPALENVASLLEPPGSTFTEPQWLSAVAGRTRAPLLLDLHNLHANASNFGWSAADALASLPLERVATVHIAGGRWIAAKGGERLLDDHRHAVPDQVYHLLTELAARAPQALTVVLERDGAYPSIDEGRARPTAERRSA